ncbi:isocitrate/isopropylmalate dehydrogenase family protein [Candidatus Bathyarchaeota archaeon]|nr:isocitrate/isopropylmalate dehydrogenase family protein [Candidatus Bathyarchaeota archaeon]
MARYRIAVIPGDGIGPEVMEACLHVLGALEEAYGGLSLEFIELEAGDRVKAEKGVALPEETLRGIKSADAALFAAAGETAGEVIIPIRRRLDLYANVRPAKAYPGVPGAREGVDLIIVRENTEGLYVGVEGRGPDWGVSMRVTTLKASERIAHYAFQLAEKLGRRKVTAVHKANVLRATCGLFLEACRRVAEDYPGIEYEEMLVDACALKLASKPEDFDILLTPNLFGDILSDEAAALIGGLGMAPSGNIGDRYAVFEPVHGSAPDIAGRGIANPMAMILSASMMLRWLGEVEAADALERTVSRYLRRGPLTPDLGGAAGTMDVALGIARLIREAF